MDKNSFEAQLLHTPFDKEDAYHSLSMPVYNTAAYEFDTAEAMEEAFCGRTADHAYSRITNPTVQYFEKRIRTITGALSVTALNSGMAAVSNVSLRWPDPVRTLSPLPICLAILILFSKVL